MFFYLIHWWAEIFFRGGYPPLEKKFYDPPLAPKVYDPPLAILAVSTYDLADNQKYSMRQPHYVEPA